jgi:outer membrane protein OmpA-like peptidoglycan-associated protein
MNLDLEGLHLFHQDIFKIMRIKIYTIVTVLLFLQSFNTGAQSSKDKYAYLRIAADKEMNALRYRYAIPYYRAYLQKTKSNDAAIIQLIGDAYFKMRRSDSAILIYNSLPEKSLLIKERLAELYATEKSYATAIKIYQELTAQNAGSARNKYYQVRIQGFSKLSVYLRDSLDWSLRYLSINSSAQEFSPFMYKDGLAFVSNRDRGTLTPKSYTWDGRGFEDIYWVAKRSSLFEIDPALIKKQAERKGLIYSVDFTPQTSNDNNTLVKRILLSKADTLLVKIPLFENLLQFNGHTGPLTISEDGNTIYFTKNKFKEVKGIHLLEICSSTKTSIGWGNVKVLSFNDPIASSYHPTINAAGTVLYFSSDRAGGFGGADLYKAEKITDSTWSAPVNLGPSVNTQGNEVFPTVKGNDLIFSSDGWSGMGGLDLFQVSLTKLRARPNNFGYPVNTSADDFGFVMSVDEQEGYLSSNRYGTDDVFGFKYAAIASLMKGVLLDEKTKKVIPSIKMYIYDEDDNGNRILVDSTITDAMGYYEFKVRPNHLYKLQAIAPKDYDENTFDADSKDKNFVDNGYLYLRRKAPATIQNITATEKKKDTVDAVVRLNELKNTAINYYTVYHPFDKATYRKVDKKIIQKVIAELKANPGYWLQVVSATDCMGSMDYNINLSSKRAQNIFNQLPKALQARTRLSWVSKTELRLPCLEDNAFNKAEQETNRYTYLFVTKVALPNGANMAPGSSKTPKLLLKGTSAKEVIDFSKAFNIEAPKKNLNK